MPDEPSPFRPRYEEESASSGPTTDPTNEDDSRPQVPEEYELTPNRQEIAQYGDEQANYPEAKPVRRVIRGRVTHDRQEEVGDSQSAVSRD